MGDEQEYLAYIGDLKEIEEAIKQGKEVIIEVRDQRYSRNVVRALISQSPEGLSDSTKLWIEGYQGRREGPWTIKVVEVLE